MYVYFLQKKKSFYFCKQQNSKTCIKSNCHNSVSICIDKCIVNAHSRKLSICQRAITNRVRVVYSNYDGYQTVRPVNNKKTLKKKNLSSFRLYIKSTFRNNQIIFRSRYGPNLCDTCVFPTVPGKAFTVAGHTTKR